MRRVSVFLRRHLLMMLGALVLLAVVVGTIALVVVGIVYLLLATGYFVRQRNAVPRLMKDGLRTNYAELTRQG